MINTKNFIYALYIFSFYGCLQPNEETIWSIDEIKTLETIGFCRNVSVSNDIAYIAAGQSGVQLWNLSSGEILNEFLGYNQDGTFIEFDDIAIIEREEMNNLIFVTESNKKVKIFRFGDDNEFVFRNEIMSDRTKDYISFGLFSNQFAMYVADNDDGLKWGTYRSDTTNVFGLEIINWVPSNGGEILSNGKPLGIDSDGVSKIAMAVDQLGVEFYRIDSLTGEPSFTSRIDLEGNAEQVKLTEDGVFISCDDAGAYFLPNDYINSDQGSAIRFAQDLTVDHIEVQNNIAVLSIGSRGIALYDVSDIFNPEPRGIFDVGYTYRSQSWQDKILVCTRSGLKIISINN